MANPLQNAHQHLFSEFEVLSSVKICIVIPVKDEEIYLLKTLQAFADQVDLQGNKFEKDQFEILILANNCSDNSVAIIRNFQQENPLLSIFLTEITLTKPNANIGYVRRILMNTAFERLQKNGGGIIMTTDGDTQVSSDWIVQTLAEFENGADAVGGRILLSENELEFLDDVTAEIHFKDEEYQLLIAALEAEIFQTKNEENPCHHQHFNGSFAVTTGCYERSGGIPDVTHLEDCAFYDRLQRIDAKVHHSSKVIVHTSARCIGRTEVGLSSQLNEWKSGGLQSSELMVTSAETHLNHFMLKKNLKNIWEQKIETLPEFKVAIKQIIPSLTVKKEDYLNYQSSIYFGTWFSDFLAKHHKNWVQNFSVEPIDLAIEKLKVALQDYSSEVFSQTSIR